MQRACDTAATDIAHHRLVATRTDVEHLTTGWEPNAPIEDTLLRRYVCCWARLCEAFATAAGGRATQTPAFAAADTRRPSGWYNTATLLQPPGADTFEATLHDIEAFFAGGSGEALLWSVWPTPDLHGRGWRLEGHPPILVRAPADVVAPPAAPDIWLTEVVDAADLAVWERVAIDGFPLPELAEAAPGSLADPRILDDARLRLTVGWDHAQAVSVGAQFADCGINCFALGVTLPEARRRGHWRAHAIDRLTRHPELWTVGHFSDDSRPPAEALGFVAILRTTLWTRARP